MSHHNKHDGQVEVIFNKSVGQYERGQVSWLPVDLWLLSILRGKLVSVLNPANLVFNEGAQSVEDIWVKETPKGKTDDYVSRVIESRESKQEPEKAKVYKAPEPVKAPEAVSSENKD